MSGACKETTSSLFSSYRRYLSRVSVSFRRKYGRTFSSVLVTVVTVVTVKQFS